MSNFYQPQGEEDKDLSLRATSSNSRAEVEGPDRAWWLSRWNQGLDDARILPIQANETGLSHQPLANGSTYSTQMMDSSTMGSAHIYPSNPWQQPAIPYSQSAIYATGIATVSELAPDGTHSNCDGERLQQRFESGPRPTALNDPYQYEGPSFFEQISAEQEQFMASLGRSSASSPDEDRMWTPTRQHQIRPLAEAGSASLSTSHLLPSDALSGRDTSAQPVIAGPSTRVVSSAARAIREAMFSNPAYHSACTGIVDIMAQFKLPLEVGDAFPIVPGSIRQQANEMLNGFISAQSDEIQRWLNSGRTGDVASDDIMKAAVLRRSSGTRVHMHYCYWCDLWLTTKGNLANHIRSHLGFHISFCENCNFSAVTPTLPSRHRGRCRGGRRGGV